MSRPEFETVVAQATKESLQTISIERTSQLANNYGSEVVNIYAPAGTIARIVNVRIDVEASLGAASGEMYAFMRFDMPALGQGVDLTAGYTNFNKPLKFNLMHWETADKKQVPADIAAQGFAVRGAEFDDVTPLQFVVANGTNVAYNGKRIYTVTTINRQIAK